MKLVHLRVAFLTVVVALVTVALGRSLPRRGTNVDNLEARDVPESSDFNIARSELNEPQLSKRTDAFPYTNDQAVNIGVGRWWFIGQTAKQVTDFINLHHARLTQIRVEDPSTPTFAVSMVANSGSYASGWWWYYGVDAAALSTLLDGKRLISLDPYHTSAGLRFAAIMVPNTGVQGRAWWWYFGVDVATVTKHVNENNARLVSARPYNDNGLVYAVIMVSNTDVDTKGWQWLPDSSISAISAAVNANQRRVVSLAPNPTGGWDAILINSEGECWWWWFSLDPTTVTNNLISHNTRLIDLSSYVSNGVRKYAVVELDDSNPEQAPINPESTRVHSFAEDNGWKGGFHGVYAIRSSTGENPIVAYNSDFRFEPASAIKILYLLYTLKQGVSMSDPITYYWIDNTTPPPTYPCPLDVPETPANARTTTIGAALTGMIQSSNNIYTRAFAIHWGTGPVQAMATELGMSSTFLRQAYIGCGFRGAVRNEVTLADFATLYLAIDNGTALSSAARKTFLDTLVGGRGAGGVSFQRVISEEAGVMGKSSLVPQFMSSLDVRWKGGSYGFPLAPSGTSKVDYSIAGLAYIPFKDSSGIINSRSYLFGDFIADLVIHCPTGVAPPCPASGHAGSLLLGAAVEALRGPIRDAIATWPSPMAPGSVGVQSTGMTTFIGWLNWIPGGEWAQWINSPWEY